MGTHSMRRCISENRGQTLIEFSIVAFLLIMLLIGVLDVCRLILTYTTIANAARIGTRYAIVHGVDSPVSTSQIQTVVQSYLGSAAVNCTGCVNVTYQQTTTTPPANCTKPGCTVQVSVAYTYQPFTTYFPLTVPLSNTSQGVIVY